MLCKLPVIHLFTPKVLHKHWDNCNTQKKLVTRFWGSGWAGGKEGLVRVMQKWRMRETFEHMSKELSIGAVPVFNLDLTAWLHKAP